MPFLKQLVSSDAYLKWEERVRQFVAPGTQSSKAAELWAGLTDCEAYFSDPLGRVRSEWVAEQIGKLGITSLLEVGCNSGRNLAAVHEKFPGTILKGIDVNQQSIEFARQKSPQIEFEVVNANSWSESARAWDATLTMSLIDHIPDESIARLARNLCETARKYVISVELWDGADGWRGQYKYSRDLRKIYEPLGVKTVHFEQSVGQYNSQVSLLWSYVGEVNNS